MGSVAKMDTDPPELTMLTGMVTVQWSNRLGIHPGPALYFTPCRSAFRGIALVPYHRESRTFDLKGRMLSSLSEYADNGQLFSFQRMSFAYDTTGNMISILSEVAWDDLKENEKDYD